MPDVLSYHDSVNYDQADPAKILAQAEGLRTAANMPAGLHELAGTRGESAYVFDMGTSYGALVQEGLGSKSLITQDVYTKMGRSHFGAIAQDTVACIINDLVSVGATPVVLNAYWSASSYEWLTDTTVANDFITGWRKACDAAHVVWGGGETQSLQGIVVPGALELAGSAFGIIANKDQAIRGENLVAGDAIVLIASSGVHANGISLIRQMAATLADGYATLLDDGKTLGDTVLIPSYLYTNLVHALQAAAIPIHYLSNITGHGWRKIMRAVPEFTYRLSVVPEPQTIFSFIAKQTSNSDNEMYATFNMGAGFAVYVAAEHADKVVATAAAQGLTAWVAGSVEVGPKQVIIEPKHITYNAASLEVR